MSIANELSNEVAVWLLAHRSPSNPTTVNHNDAGSLRQIILELHTTLRRLKSEERAARRFSVMPSSGLKSSAANAH